MPAIGRTYYIAGAGIAGMTLALALAKFGANVVVLERNAAVSEFGAGLQIGPNARRLLDRLGLDDALREASLEPEGIDIYPDGAARPLVTLALGEAMRARFGAPYAVMHRGDLADVLHRACRRFANIDILYGTLRWNATSGDEGVALEIEDASGDVRRVRGVRSVRGVALIGADGVHSQTRRTLLDGPEATFRGRVAWRVLLPFDSAPPHLGRDRVSVLFGPGFHTVCYPLPHRGQFNVVLFARGDAAGEPGAEPRLPAAKIRTPALRALLETATGNWTAWPLYTVDAARWHRGNIGLIGDAAHAMLPFQAQGAAMAIEDAAVLAPLLVSSTSAEAAFTRFAALRQRRVRRVAAVSRGNGTIFHLPWPISLGRDLAVRLGGSGGQLRRLAWLYGHDAQAGLNLSASAPR